MNLPEGLWPKILYLAVLGSAAAALFSIAVSQILLGVAIVAFLVVRPRLELPGWMIPLGLFVVWTLLGWLSGGAQGGGLPQIRKLYVLTLLPLVYLTLRGVADFKALALAWLAAGTVAAIRSCWQFAAKWTYAVRAGEDFYRSYVADRITGFMSHWMTFSSQMMFVFLVSLCLLLWGGLGRRLRWLAMFALAVTGTALVLGFTRGIWIATAAAVLFLLARWKPWSVLVLPVALIAITAAGPESLRNRVTSMVRDHGQLDSNQHRIACWSTGLVMIETHPVLGVGLEQVGRQFNSYAPARIPRPLPEGFYGHLHNIYLQYAAERGIPAAVFMVVFLVWPAWIWLRASRRLISSARAQASQSSVESGDRESARPAGPISPHPSLWALNLGIAIVIGVLVTGIFEHNLGDSEVLMLALSVLGATGAAHRELNRSLPG
ncbi:MAG TPA: O-antigen ligase family protein [Bryobacteraceae bacterium]|nr:O-antigen ligase family protein [Bryobacteraceae bacterium]HPT26340.1 O-antigen ligase family protein [Bryobacteraceae bacterium]